LAAPLERLDQEAPLQAAALRLATPDQGGRVSREKFPSWVQDGRGGAVSGAVFMVSYANREEKGSDVNVAAHLLLDVLAGPST
jgi:hypothetical protein